MIRTFSLLLALALPSLAAAQQQRPNVIVIIADDMGYGDLGCHGNPVIRTPHLDRFATQSVQLRNFYVSPVCSPTRASLLTGRYNYRTGVVDTYLGRSLMHAEETTLAESLAQAGYRCGIFGKWHLGDNYPLRAIDQGFHEALVLKGGGIGQPSDPPRPPGGSSYFDPVLQHNGKEIKTKGYCSDVFTDAAIRFIEASGASGGVQPRREPGGEDGGAKPRRSQPFFAWLAFNCPHDPLQAPEGLYREYQKASLAHDVFPKLGQPLTGKANEDQIARVYAMITNIDDNLGRLFAKLDELKLAEDTIMIFLTDNGPAHPRFNAGLRDRKGSVYEGGIRVPFYIRWPGKLDGGRKVDHPAAHIDLAPTLLEMCGVPKPANVRMDGVNLWTLLRGAVEELPARTLFLQWHRGDEPELFRAFAVRQQRWKLVQAAGRAQPAQPKFELFDIPADPYEEHDLAVQQPEKVEELKRKYEAWFKDVSATRGYAPPRIHIGAAQENPTVLTRQDWRGPRAGWRPEDLGHWEVQIVRAGRYDVTLRFAAAKTSRRVQVTLGGVHAHKDVAADAAECLFSGLQLTPGPARLEASLGEGKDVRGVQYVIVERRE